MARGIVYWVQLTIPWQGYIDSGSVYLKLTPFSTDVQTFAYTDTGTIYLDLQPSGVDQHTTPGYVDTGIVYLDLQLSSVDEKQHVDASVVTLKLTVSGVEEYSGGQQYIDATIVYLALTASSVDVYHPFDITVPGEPTWAQPPGISLPPLRPFVPWKIIHKDNVGNELGEVTPEAFRFGIFLSKPGFVNYEIDLDNHMSGKEFTSPFETDWELRRGNEVVKDLAGFHTEVQIADPEATFIQVAGQTWLHYFEHIFWPFNPTDPLQYAYTAAATDLFTIVDAILDQVLAQSDALTFTYSFGTSGQTANFKIDPGDQENILSKIDQLAKLDPGFDMYIAPTRVIQLFAPKKGVDRDITFELNRNVELVNFTDKGSKSVIKGFGSANSQRAGFVASTTGTRRYEEMKDYGEIASQASLEDLVEADHARLIVTNNQFSVRWTGRDEDDDLLDQVDVGDTVTVYGNTGYDLIDGEYRIVGIEGEISNEANADYVVTFDDGTLSL